VTYWPKIANYTHPFSFGAFIQGDPHRIYGKALRFLKLESSRQLMLKICAFLSISYLMYTYYLQDWLVHLN